MSDVLTREKVLSYIWHAESGMLDNAMADSLDRCDAALRAVIQQAVEDVEKATAPKDFEFDAILRVCKTNLNPTAYRVLTDALKVSAESAPAQSDVVSGLLKQARQALVVAERDIYEMSRPGPGRYDGYEFARKRIHTALAEIDIKLAQSKAEPKGMKDALELIADERRRQIIVEGYDAEHDDQHREGEIVDAALIYADRTIGTMRGNSWGVRPQKFSRERQLVIAAALLVAEIERLRRAEPKGKENA